MAEPIPNQPEIPKHPPVIVGETPIYVNTPVEIDGQTFSSLNILGAEKRAVSGVGSAVPLVRELSRKKGEEGMMVDKPLTNLNSFDEVPWEKVSGVQWTDAEGVTHIISKDELGLTKPEGMTESKTETVPESQAETASVTEPVSDQAAATESSAAPVEPPAETPTETPESVSVAAPDTAAEPPTTDTPATEQSSESPVAAEAEPAQELPKQEEPAPPPVPTPAKEARGVLESLQEDPNTITIVGLKAYETRALDLADRAMQRLGSPKMQERLGAQRTLWEKTKDSLESTRHLLVDSMWKQSIGGIYFHEKSRQYYLDMLKASETPFAEEAIRMAERRATDRYNQKLADANFLTRIGTKAADRLRDFVGMRTTVQNMALEEIGVMKSAGEIQGMETLDREARAVRARFGQDMDRASSFVRTQLGEKLEILDPENAEHKPLVEGIQSLMKQYASGEIADKAAFDAKTKEFFEATLKNVRPDIFAEAELYSSSLFEAAEVLRNKMSHEAGLANIDEAMAGMQIRLGLGTMGEVTSLEPTSVEKGIGKVREVFEWLNRKSVIVPMVFNEATVGSAVAIALSAAKFASTMPARAIAGIGGGALAGGLFAGYREYGQLQKDYLTHLRERESGADFTETQKKRAWFEKFAPKQRSAAEMIGTLQTSLYDESGAMKASLTDDELRSAFATVADTQARKAVSENGPKRIGLIRFTSREAIESERAALDITANRALTDLETYLVAHTEQAETVLGGNTFPDFMVKLTSGQASVLREGVTVSDAFEDPIRDTLSLVSSYAPEAGIVKRRWPFASRTMSDGDKALGLDAILDEFNKEARVEAVKYGVKAGVIGAAVGTVMHSITEIGHLEATTHTVQKMGPEIQFSQPSIDHTVLVNGHPYQIPQELVITPHPDAAGHMVYDAKIDFGTVTNLQGQPDLTLGNNMSADQLLDKFHAAGFTVDAGREAVAQSSKMVAIPDLQTQYHDSLTAQIPDGYHMVHSSPTSWDLLNAKNETIARGMHFQTDGSLSNADAVKNQLASHGLNIDADHTMTITHTGAVEAAAPPPVEAAQNNTMMTIDMKNTDEGGLWQYFLNRSHGENSMATTNGMKNLFRMYTYDQHNANISVPVDGHLRDTVYGNMHVSELNPGSIPVDAKISLPDRVFGDKGIDWFSSHSNAAIAHMNQIMNNPPAGEAIRGPMDAVNYLYNSKNAEEHLQGVILKLGYVGQDSKLPSMDDMHLLMEKMGAGEAAPAPVAVPTEAIPQVLQVHNIIITEQPLPEVPGRIFAEHAIRMTFPDTVTTIGRDTLPNEMPWIPFFLPLREGLEPVGGPEAPGMKPGDVMYSPFGNEANFLTREQVEARKSPRLTENPQAVLKQNEEITWYNAQRTPEEQELTGQLLSQHEEPISPDVRTVVTMPISQSGNSIYQRLSSYTGQTDAQGNPLNPKQTEFVVYDVSVGDMQADQTKAEIDRFRADHPETPIVYLTHTYAEQPTNGRLKRDLTNAVMTRLSTLPEDAPDVAILSDHGTTTPIAPTYLSAVTQTLEQNPNADIVTGSISLPAEAYATYPQLFVQDRAFELFDALARQGDNDGAPPVYTGNMAIRASTLAAVGGYNTASEHLNERELAWSAKVARGNTETATVIPDMSLSLDPKAVIYRRMQGAGIADPEVALEQNDTYKDMSWQDMAKKASESITQDRIQQELNGLYQGMYPSLKAANPARYDAYFKRTMDALGLTYEVTDGNITIKDMTNLGTNMATEIDMESYAKTAAAEVVAATPNQPESPREALESVAGPQDGKPESAEPTATEEVQSSISSPEVTAEPEQQPDVPSAETVPPAPEQLPEGVEDRINYVLNKTAEKGAVVDVTPGELMDYIKSSVDIAGSRVTGGSIQIDGSTVKLVDMKAHTPLGDAQFAGELITDPNRGLVVKKDSLQLKLPLLARLGEGAIRNALNDFNGLVMDHLNTKISSDWKASRIDIVGEKIEVKFRKRS